MPKFAANLTMMFNEVAFPQRFAAAATAGFKAVEFLFPYDHPAAEIKGRLDANGLQLVLHNLPAGDWAAGERGIASITQPFLACATHRGSYAHGSVWRARVQREARLPGQPLS